MSNTPSFNGVPIRVGDEVTVKLKVTKVDGSNTPIRAGYKSLQDAWLPLAAILQHTPAPRPLVPGPAEYVSDPSPRVTVLAVHDGQAWVRMPDGVLTTERYADRLRNTEGAPS
mgnify:CR=1 FL=1